MKKRTALIFVALALGLGWAIRGHFGHEHGAAWQHLKTKSRMNASQMQRVKTTDYNRFCRGGSRTAQNESNTNYTKKSKTRYPQIIDSVQIPIRSTIPADRGAV